MKKVVLDQRAVRTSNRANVQPDITDSNDSESKSKTRSMSRFIKQKEQVNSNNNLDLQSKHSTKIIPKTEKSSSEPAFNIKEPTLITPTKISRVGNQKSEVKLLNENKVPLASLSPKPPKREGDDIMENLMKNFLKVCDNPDCMEKTLETNAQRLLKRNVITFSCCICTENYYTNTPHVQCNSVFTGKGDEIHKLCKLCLIQTTAPEIVNLDEQGRGIKCPSDYCDNVLLMSEVQKLMDEGPKEQLHERIGVLSIAAANIPDCYKCPNCGFVMIVEDTKPSYECFQCSRQNCKHCDREYIGDHKGRTCQELIEYEQKAKHIVNA